jgi:hypothetical protein
MLTISRYKIGDGFVSLPLEEVQEMLSTSTAKIEEEVAALEEKLGEIRLVRAVWQKHKSGDIAYDNTMIPMKVCHKFPPPWSPIRTSLDCSD